MKRFILLIMTGLFFSEAFSQTNVFPSSGNVGIGTTAPFFPLTVSGEANASQGFFVSGNNTIFNNQGGYMMWNLSGWIGETDFINNQGGGTGGFRWYNTPPSGTPLTEIMTLTGSGNLGIGTSMPGDLLSVAGNSSAAQFVSYNISSPTVLVARTSQRISLKVDNGATEAVSIIPGGNVGVGTTSPQSKLAVNGTITAQEVKVTQTGWSDFVFDSAYRLPTLSKTEIFIKTNHHLPDIPSAKEIENNGLDLGSMEQKQMRKIEELTLYVIKLENKYQQLEQDMKAMEQKNDAIEKQLKVIQS